MAKTEDHDAAFNRWVKYERECYLANTAHHTLVPPSKPPTDRPNVVYPRESLLEFRAAYVLLRNAVAELLDLDPETMTQMQVILAVAKKKWADREDSLEEPIHD